jgi:hypothetical protein
LPYLTDFALFAGCCKDNCALHDTTLRAGKTHVLNDSTTERRGAAGSEVHWNARSLRSPRFPGQLLGIGAIIMLKLGSTAGESIRNHGLSRSFTSVAATTKVAVCQAATDYEMLACLCIPYDFSYLAREFTVRSLKHIDYRCHRISSVYVLGRTWLTTRASACGGLLFFVLSCFVMRGDWQGPITPLDELVA